MMRLTPLVFIGLIILCSQMTVICVSSDNTNQFSMEWWNTNWKVRCELIINTTHELRDFQVKITIKHDESMTQNFSDIRFVQKISNEYRVLNYWFENISEGNYCTVWVRFPILRNGEVAYMYYGNKNAQSLSSINLTMDRGLRYFYYNDTNLTEFLGTDIDTYVSHDWGGGIVQINGHPWEGKSDIVSIKWEGWLIPPTNGTYGFYVRTDDGSRLYVNDSLIINEWFNQPATEYNASYYLHSIVPIKYEWFEGIGLAVAQLGWKAPKESMVYPIPIEYIRCRKYASPEPKIEFGDKKSLISSSGMFCSPKKPSEGDEVLITARLYNEINISFRTNISFHIGDDFNLSKVIKTVSVEFLPMSESNVTVIWNSTGGTYTFWCSVYGYPIDSIRIHVNHIPRIHPIKDHPVMEDKTLTIIAKADDEDNESLVWNISPPIFEISILSNDSVKLSWLPKNSDVGKHKFLLTVRDSLNKTSSCIFNVTVTNVNDPPMLYDMPKFYLKQGISFYYKVEAYDEDVEIGKDKLTYHTNSSFFEMDRETGEINFTPIDDDVGIHLVKIWVEDEGGLEDYKNVTFVINNTNDPPVINVPKVLNATEDVEFLFKINATDPDLDSGDSLSFSDNTTLFEVNNRGIIKFTPRDEDVGRHSIKITVHDSYMSVASAEFILNIENTNDPPYLDDIGDVVAREGERCKIIITAHDDDLDSGDSLRFETNTTIISVDEYGVIEFVPTNEDVGVHNIRIRVIDSYNKSDETSFKLTIINVNTPPYNVSIISPKDGDVFKENEEISLKGIAYDEDIIHGDKLTYRWYCDGIKICEGENATWMPLPGEHVITLEVSDSQYNTSSYKINITVEEVMKDGDKNKESYKIPLIIFILLLIPIFLVLLAYFLTRKKRTKDIKEDDIDTSGVIPDFTSSVAPTTSESPPVAEEELTKETEEKIEHLEEIEEEKAVEDVVKKVKDDEKDERDDEESDIKEEIDDAREEIRDKKSMEMELEKIIEELRK